VSDEKKRTPENCGPNGEMVLQMTGARAEFTLGLTVFIEARKAKAVVCGLIVVQEVEVVFYKGRPGKCVVANAITPDPGVGEWQ